MKEFKRDPDADYISFYWDGWRYGKILKVHSESCMSVEDCTGRHHRIMKNEKGNWVAFRHKNFKGENHLRKEKKDVKKEKKTEIKKGKGKRRIKIKAKRRIIRKSRKNT